MFEFILLLSQDKKKHFPFSFVVQSNDSSLLCWSYSQTTRTFKSRTIELQFCGISTNYKKSILKTIQEPLVSRWLSGFFNRRSSFIKVLYCFCWISFQILS